MSHKKYIRQLDLSADNAYKKTISQVVPNSYVLEIGTSSGYLSQYLTEEMGCKVYGVELDPTLASLASPHLVKMYQKDLNKIADWIGELPEHYFDHIVLLDVLEHVYFPFEVLNFLRTKLKPTGNIIVSIPNVSHSIILFELLRNRFTYTELGMLDNTHIRFYTTLTLSEKLAEYGFTLTKADYTYMTPVYSELGTDYDQMNVFEREVILRKDYSHVFQNVFTFRPKEYCPDLQPVPIHYSSTGKYDILTIYNQNKQTKYDVHKSEIEISYKVDHDTELITISPSVRFRAYQINLTVNGLEYLTHTQMLSDNNYWEEKKAFVSNGSQKIKVARPFKAGDVLNITIKYLSTDIFQNLLLGQTYMHNSLNTLKSKIEEFDTISFDIFDTLLLRNVLIPTDIFRILEKEVAETYQIEGFFEKRVWAENESRRNTDTQEVTIHDIYKTLEQKIEPSICSQIMALELAKEEEFLVANPFMLEAFNYAKSRGKHILILSDMYLESSFVAKILAKCGYEGYHGLHISGEEKASKHLGNLYDKVKDQYTLKPKKWLHVGDNIHADIAQAEDKGIQTYHYEKVLDRAGLDSSTRLPISESIVRAIQYNFAYNGLEMPYWEKFGALQVAPVYFGFTNWLTKVLHGKDNAYFLSRDGYIIHKIYEIFREKLPHLPQGKYLYTSRKAYQLPGLVHVHKNIAVDVLTQRNTSLGQKSSVQDIFDVVDVDLSDKLDIVQNFGFESLEDEVNDENLHDIRKLVAFLFNDIDQNLKAKCDLLVQYLEQEGFTGFAKPNIIDVGWRGSIQFSMKNILDKEIDGFYFGTNEHTYQEIMSNSYGYMVDLGVPFERNVWMAANITMYELLFSAPHGTLTGFRKDENGKVLPILDESKETETYNNLVAQFQATALELNRQMVKYLEYTQHISKEFSISAYNDFITARRYDDMLEFKKLTNNVGYSLKQYGYVNIYTKEFIQKHRDEFFNTVEKSLWRNAFFIEGIDNEKDYRAFLKANHLNHTIFKHPAARKLLTLSNLSKALRNPKKAISVLKQKVKNKFRKVN